MLVGIVVKHFNLFTVEEPAVEIDADYVSAFRAKAAQINSGQFEVKGTALEGTNETSRQPGPKNSLAEGDTGKRVAHPAVASRKDFLVDINLANAEELQMIPRIGAVLAQRIIQYRQENGRFSRLQDLKRVKGIGAATFNKILPYVAIGSKGADSK
ncbi:MAG: ComEA family DNA-binding protein [bacterium]